MTPEEAEEYTQSLGQIVAGSWRQIRWADRQGIPAALGLSLREWVSDRLGGYVRLEIPERREAVAELTEEGMSQRNIGDVLGVNRETVGRDQRGANVSVAPEEPQVSEPDEAEPDTDASPEPEAARDPIGEAVAEARSAPVVVGSRVIEQLSKSLQQLGQIGGIEPVCADLLASPLAGVTIPLWIETLTAAETVITNWRQYIESVPKMRRVQ